MKHPPIFIVNLERDREKRKYCEAQLSELGMEYTFISAIDGSSLDDEVITTLYDSERCINSIFRDLSKGEIGCALSHKLIYEKMAKENIQEAIIFEDDVIIGSEFKNIIEKRSKLPPNWQCVLFGHHGGVRYDREGCKSFWDRVSIYRNYKCVRFSAIAYGTYGYLINLAGAQRLLTHITKVSLPLDRYTGDDNYINLYGISPVCIEVKQESEEKSNIATGRSEKQSTIPLSFSNRKEKAKLLLQRMGLLNVAQKVFCFYRIITKSIFSLINKSRPPKGYK